MMRRLLPCLIAVCALAAEERDRDQPYQGMDVIGAVKAVKEAISPTVPDIAKGKPWENDLAALTSPEPRRHNPAMSNLIRRGSAVLGDLAVLAEDPDWQIRQRVVRVAAWIGTDAGAAIVLGRTHDQALSVCIEAAMGLGQVKGPLAFPRLAELLTASEPDLRAAAASGMGMLGDVRGLDALLTQLHEHDDLARREMRSALSRIVNQSQAVPALAERLAHQRGTARTLLVEMSGQVGDPRLCPVLTGLIGDADADLAQRAVRSLAANGDSRAVEALCRIADSHASPSLQAVAAATLRQLTGYEAAPGPAWRLWWQQHRAEVERIMPRDALLAALHDPARNATREELAAFTVADLAPLLDGALGSGPPWWPARAFAAMAADVPARWTPLLEARITAAPVASLRLPLLLILDQLGDPGASAVFRSVLDRDQEAKKLTGPERLAISIALERRPL